jgi:hypothetical protein
LACRSQKTKHRKKREGENLLHKKLSNTASFSLLITTYTFEPSLPLRAQAAVSAMIGRAN